MKNVAANTPIPTYSGDDDLEIFMRWLQDFLAYIDINELVGETNDYHRVLTTRLTLKGAAATWYDNTIQKAALHRAPEPISFQDVILRLADSFITPAAATRAQQSFDRVIYVRKKGIRAYVRELQMLSYHVLTPIDEYTLRKQIIDIIPSSIRNMLIDYKGLSVSTSSVAEWVDAIDLRERELLEREAYESLNSTRTHAGPSQRANPSRSGQPHVSANAPRQGASSSRTYADPARNSTNDRAAPTGPHVAPRQRVPLEEVTCHACGRRGHYHGSRECPKTPSSARLHALNVEGGRMESPTPDSDPEDDNFDGVEYDGDADPDLEGDDNQDDQAEVENLGVVIASIHAAESDIEIEADDVSRMATMAATDGDEALANEILQEVKDQYELRGSGLKTRPQGPTPKQLKAEAEQPRASNSNVRTSRKEPPRYEDEDRRGLTTIVKINGVDAYTCWDTGSQLDCVSPDFIRASSIPPQSRATPLKIHLGTKGSSSATSYEVSPLLEVGNLRATHRLDVVNLHKWDLVLGSVFCNKHKVVLDYGTRQIHFGDTVIPALDDEDGRPQQTPKHARVGVISAEPADA